jgi:hypothetical protein
VSKRTDEGGPPVQPVPIQTDRRGWTARTTCAHPDRQTRRTANTTCAHPDRQTRVDRPYNLCTSGQTDKEDRLHNLCQSVLPSSSQAAQ